MTLKHHYAGEPCTTFVVNSIGETSKLPSIDLSVLAKVNGFDWKVACLYNECDDNPTAARWFRTIEAERERLQRKHLTLPEYAAYKAIELTAEAIEAAKLQVRVWGGLHESKTFVNISLDAELPQGSVAAEKLAEYVHRHGGDADKMYSGDGSEQWDYVWDVTRLTADQVVVFAKEHDKALDGIHSLCPRQD